MAHRILGETMGGGRHEFEAWVGTDILGHSARNSCHVLVHWQESASTSCWGWFHPKIGVNCKSGPPLLRMKMAAGNTKRSSGQGSKAGDNQPDLKWVVEWLVKREGQRRTAALLGVNRRQCAVPAPGAVDGEDDPCRPASHGQSRRSRPG